MSDDLKAYVENMKQPWWLLFFRVVWSQLSPVGSLKILDFGSGLGITASHLAKNNHVIAIERNVDLVDLRICENDYQQVIGDEEKLKLQKENSFDVIVCHNVLEYAEEPNNIFREFSRILKPNGIISLVKHNHVGRIMSKVIFENNLDEAIMLLNGGASNAAYFGQIKYYYMEDIRRWIKNSSLNIEKVLGVRTFWGLQQDNKIKYDSVWQEKMFEIEMKVSDIDDYKNISFYNHILLRKLS